VIDDGLIDDWDQPVIDALARFDQGDLVERPPFFYAALPAHATWHATSMMRGLVADSEDIVVDLDPDDRPPYGVVTSQGCDIADVFRKPWVQIAPVWPASKVAPTPQALANIQRGAVPHLLVLEVPSLEGTWIADLRIEVPVEKSWLSDRVPIAGFASEASRRDFAQRLAGRLERPALPDRVHELVVRPLRRFLDRANSTRTQLLADNRIEFRLASATHDGLTVCRLLAIARKGSVPDEIASALDGWWDRVAKTLETEPDVSILANRYGSSSSVSMDEYLSSVLLDERFLESGA
jgi:hypothetical protein